MPRILLLIVLVWIVYVVLKRFIANAKSNDRATKTTAHTEKFVACSQCGLHIPESESRMIDNLTYCNNPKCNNAKK